MGTGIKEHVPESGGLGKVREKLALLHHGGNESPIPQGRGEIALFRGN